MGPGLRVTSCDTDGSLVAAAGLFNRYRHHYGESVGAVRAAAVATGATRLSLVTEPDNAAALAFYRGLGFRQVDGLVPLSVDLAPRTTS